MTLNKFYVDDTIKNALKEDINYLDVTTDYLIDEDATTTARFVAKSDGVLCGLEVALENQRDNLLATLKVVGGIREDKVETLTTTLKIEEHIGLDSVEILELKLSCRLADKVMMYAIYLHRGDTTRLARRKLITYRACAREEVQHIQLLEINKVDKDIKEVLLGKVRRRSSPKITRGHNGTTTIFSTYNSHINNYYQLYTCYTSPP